MKVFVFGHNGLVGEAVTRALAKKEHVEIVTKERKDLDLLSKSGVRKTLLDERPDAVVLAAAKVGGIKANFENPVAFLSENLQIQTNVIDASHEANVSRLVFLGSSCVYPREAGVPIREDALLSGHLEKTNEAYAVAKIAGLKLVEAYNSQFEKNWVSAMPTNVYGLNDNFTSDDSHVIPALVRRINQAVEQNAQTVDIWGSGRPIREFIHSDDLAKAIVHLITSEDLNGLVNIGTGEQVSIRELAELIAELSGFLGSLRFDASKPDGTFVKTLDSSVMQNTGWRPSITLRKGLAQVISAYRRSITGK